MPVGAVAIQPPDDQAGHTDDADAIWNIFQKVVAGRDSYAFLPDTPRDEAVGYWLGNDAIARVAEIDGRVVGMR